MERSGPARYGIRWELLLLAACAALYLAALGAYYVGFFNDDAFYLIGARSLLEGRFAELSHPAQPPLTPYLPGYPLLLAPLVWLFPDSFLPCQLLSAALTLGAVRLAWESLERLGPRPRFAAAALVGLSPLTVSLSGTVLSDPAYLLTSMLVFRLRQRMLPSRDLRHWALLAALAASVFYLRPVGAALPAALVLALVLERRPREAAACAVASAAVILPWLLREGFRLSYAEEFLAQYVSAGSVSAASSILVNGAYYARELFARAFFRWPGAAPGGTFETAATAAGLIVAAYGVRRSRPGAFTLAYCALYCAAHLLWAKPSGRYLLGMLPFAAGALVNGAEELGAKLRVRGAPSLTLLALSLLLVSPTLEKIVLDASRKGTRLTSPPARTLEWVRRNTRPDDIFAAESTGSFFLLTGRRALRLRGAAGPEEFRAWLRGQGAGYVAVFPIDFALKTPSGRNPYDPADPGDIQRLAEGSGGFVRVFKDSGEGTTVYRALP